MINSSVTNNDVNRGYSTEPLSPWAYFGYTLLFYLPIIGLVFLIIYSFDNTNINRRNFARSYFCLFMLSVFLGIILSVIGTTTGLFTMMMQRLAMQLKIKRAQISPFFIKKNKIKKVRFKRTYLSKNTVHSASTKPTLSEIIQVTTQKHPYGTRYKPLSAAISLS